MKNEIFGVPLSFFLLSASGNCFSVIINRYAIINHSVIINYDNGTKNKAVNALPFRKFDYKVGQG